ncbi:hypothetical protein LU631_14990 [Erwinia tracheiphila]|uniref:Uncharacterized protein n=1 Tax=Erwinia tracheiphila TaxID=65700 RepID=A0A0M2KBN2_9GAMM|nr:hypothetical protein [Erwinia tracheiphila]AXF75913.1 hypothetical protein AV903_07350 [Erwinia tracheiphila]EOS96908.1 hypothetical protein ETR_00170 [Erwinia tracheiphila PSU-1]KKF34648.1 hypothetical protein SY86_03045 [Erwinia tracheiphila]UIA85426.1 hypothetical protein LU604_11880 [Erwinia tracheiphila]UIA86322.1 hypothetical protein LU631_14990 [Erwinia tracheiphila]
MSEKKLASTLESEVICLNYIDFLSASCKKRWSFVDAIYGVMPIFGMVTKSASNLSDATSERLKALALQIISTQVSDEINISRLIILAEQQHINQFDILLPYPLSEFQLEAIRQEYSRPLELRQANDILSVKTFSLSH